MTSVEKAKEIYKVTDQGIYGFFGPHRFLSNYHLCSIEWEGNIYPSTENAYQASKISPGSDQPFIMDEGMRRIERLDFVSFEPRKAKSMGRTLSLRGEWLQLLPQEETYRDEFGPTIGTSYPLIYQVRDKIMYDLNVIKFSNPYLKNLLMLTGDKYLEETNWWRDDYWGVWEGNGLNKLGRILMKIRDELKKTN